MIVNIFYIGLAVLGLSLLIFVHELGHYWMARRVGMSVEVFSIGFGRPLISWIRKGVRWQVGWLPFGGYVKIKGQELEKGTDPYEISDGFFGKSPLDRIKVAFMGPFVNIVFALVVFCGLWMLGGREKNFSDFTHKIGWVDPHSELYTSGIRPGDEISEYDQRPFLGAKDNLYAPLIGGEELEVKGYRVNYQTGDKQPFQLKVKSYPHPSALDKGVKTAGILNNANYIIYNKLPNGADNPLPEGSPLQGSGIEYGDRIVWVDGENVYSAAELSHILNDNRVLLTVEREGKTFLRRVPRVYVQELRLDSHFKEELTDWQFEAQLNNTKFQKLYAIPYNLSNECVVENEAKFIDKENQEEAFPSHPFSDLELPLQPGDKIIAVDGFPVFRSYELLSQIQTHHVNIIVKRNAQKIAIVPYGEADEDFDKDVDWKDLQKIASSIGTAHPLTHTEDLALLKPVIPKMRTEFTLSPEKQAWLTTELLEQKKEIEAIEDPERRAQALHQLDLREKQLLLGFPMVQDRKVTYNPGPIELFANVFQEIWRTLTALLSGTMNPKWLSGPVGIVQVMTDNSMISLKESFFWLGAISLNLGILNLLPIPVLDGGTIVMTFVEMITRRKINPKTMEKIVIPFAILLVVFFVFLTYQDLTRIFGHFWRW